MIIGFTATIMMLAKMHWGCVMGIGKFNLYIIIYHLTLGSASKNGPIHNSTINKTPQDIKLAI
jgi:hypothetical protein